MGRKKTLLSNRPVGALVGIARPVVNSVGLSFKMAPEGVLEFTCLEKVSIYCNILFEKRASFTVFSFAVVRINVLVNHHVLSSQDLPESEISMVKFVLMENKIFRIERFSRKMPLISIKF